MTWIFGSFLETSCALSSCHVVISKQSSAPGHSGPTGVLLEGDYMITTRSDLDRVQRIESRARDTLPVRGVPDDMACKRVQALAPPGSRKKVWDKKMSPL